MSRDGQGKINDTWGETQVGGFIPNHDVEHIDYIVAETGTSRVAVLRAMIRACLADPDRFVAEWMPKPPELVPFDDRPGVLR